MENCLPFVFGCTREIRDLAVDAADEKLLLRSTILAAANKMYLDCCFKLYDVPKEKRAAITSAVLQMDLHTMALGIIQKTVQQAEKGFEALTEKQI